MTIAELVAQAQTLSVQERKLLITLLIDSLDAPPTPGPQRRLSELRGLGKEIWTGIDAQEYVDHMRDEWDRHP